MNDRKKFALGILLGLVVVTLVAFVPSLTDFNSGQFNTDNRTVTIGNGATFTNIGIRSLQVYQVDTNTVALRVFGFGFHGQTNILQQWLVTPYPGGTPNLVASIDTNGVATFGGGVTEGASGVVFTDTVTGKAYNLFVNNLLNNVTYRLQSSYYTNTYTSTSNLVWAPTNGALQYITLTNDTFITSTQALFQAGSYILGVQQDAVGTWKLYLDHQYFTTNLNSQIANGLASFTTNAGTKGFVQILSRANGTNYAVSMQDNFQ